MKKFKILFLGICLSTCFNLAFAKENNFKNIKKIEFKKTNKKNINKYSQKQEEILNEALKKLNKKEEKLKKYKFTINQKKFIKLVKEKLNMKKEEEFGEKELSPNNKKGIFTQEQIFNEYEKLMKKNFEKNKQDKTIFLSYMYLDNNLQIVLTPSKDNAQGFKMEVFYGEGSKKIDLYKEFLKK